MHDQIADVAADLVAGVVDENRCAERFHLAFETQGDVTLLARQAIDLDELDEQVFKPFLINQNGDLAVLA
jgi:hypothetical protein